jgi:hypothetical protein
MNQPASSLRRAQPKAALTEGQLLALGAKAYHEHEILVVRLSRLNNPIDRQMARSIAERLYGRREA